METAEIIAPSLGVDDVVQDCDLCELHPGDCDGADWDDQVRVRGTGGEWDPDEPMSPGGESLRDFHLRVRASLTEWSQPPGSGDWVLDRYNDTAHLPALP